MEEGAFTCSIEGMKLIKAWEAEHLKRCKELEELNTKYGEELLRKGHQKTRIDILEKQMEEKDRKIAEIDDLVDEMFDIGDNKDTLLNEYAEKLRALLPKPEPILSCDAHACMYCKKPIEEGNCCGKCMKRILEGKKPSIDMELGKGAGKVLAGIINEGRKQKPEGKKEGDGK